jgi:hypothetical protein
MRYRTPARAACQEMFAILRLRVLAWISSDEVGLGRASVVSNCAAQNKGERKVQVRGSENEAGAGYIDQSHAPLTLAAKTPKLPAKSV